MFIQVDKKNKERSMHHFGHGFSVLFIVWLVTRTTFCQETTTTQAPPRTLQVRLVGGTRPSEGRVEVMHNGTWSTICDDSWDLPDAHVVCRMLGYTGAARALSKSYFGLGEAGILLDDVECIGNETSLEDCQHPGFYEHDCIHYEDAAVVCSPGDNSSDYTYSNSSSSDYSSDYSYGSSSINDSALFPPQNETCVAGHCYLDSNNVSRCIPAVDICGKDVPYKGLVCIGTPIRPILSSIRCMSFNERAQTDLPIPEVISALNDTLSRLPYPKAADKIFGLLANPRDLQLLPQFIYYRQRRAKVLVLSGYELQHIEDNAFAVFTSLRILFLSDNKIPDIEVGAFDDMQSLLALYLPSNSIQHIERGVFSGLQFLQYLFLTSNSIQHIERGVFSGLQSLDNLQLSHNKIRDIEVGAFDDLQSLLALNLSSNSIQHLERGVFSGLWSLQYL